MIQSRQLVRERPSPRQFGARARARVVVQISEVHPASHDGHVLIELSYQCGHIDIALAGWPLLTISQEGVHLLLFRVFQQADRPGVLHTSLHPAPHHEGRQRQRAD